MRTDWSIAHRLIFIPIKFNMASNLTKFYKKILDILGNLENPSQDTSGKKMTYNHPVLRTTFLFSYLLSQHCAKMKMKIACAIDLNVTFVSSPTGLPHFLRKKNYHCKYLESARWNEAYVYRMSETLSAIDSSKPPALLINNA